MNKFLKFIKFSELTYWTAKRYFITDLKLTNKYPQVLFGQFLAKYSSKIINIEDEKVYKIIGVRSYGKGAYINREVQGQSLNMKKYQLVEPNLLLWCKVDTKNGAFGIVTENLVPSYASSNMALAKINNNLITNDYLQLLFTCPQFHKYLDLFVSGTTNRKYIKIDELLTKIKIPLPSLEKQKEIVDRYNEKIKLAEEQEKEAQNLEQEIDNYFLEKLGIKQIQKNLKCTKNKYLTFINFKNLKRWDALAQNFYIYDLLKTSQYKLCKLGNVYNFINRSWIKKGLSKNQEYKYVEIGSVDLIKGITETKKITINNAPSRATQIIKNGDLIIGTTRPYLKKFAIVDEKHDNCICSSGFQVIEPSKSYNLLFLKEFLSSDIGIEQLKNKMTGALYPAITFEELKNILIPLPSLEIQNEVITTITKTKLQIKNLKETSEQNRQLAQEEFEKELFE